MEEKKGTGVFLGVVAVATLIVAIIGATFAYFSISAASNTDAIDLTAYEFNTSLSVSTVYPETAGRLIPLNPGTTITGAPQGYNTNLLYTMNYDVTINGDSSNTDRCVDSKGFQVCAVYEAVFTNNSDDALTFSGVLKTVSNTASTSTGRTGAQAFQDLKLQLLTGNVGEAGQTAGTLNPDGTAVSIGVDPDDTVNIPGTVTVPARTDNGNDTYTAGTATIRFVVYLNENGDQSAQMGARFNGQLIYTATNGTGTELTGTFTLS